MDRKLTCSSEFAYLEDEDGESGNIFLMHTKEVHSRLNGVKNPKPLVVFNAMRPSAFRLQLCLVNMYVNFKVRGLFLSAHF